MSLGLGLIWPCPALLLSPWPGVCSPGGQKSCPKGQVPGPGKAPRQAALRGRNQSVVSVAQSQSSGWQAAPQNPPPRRAGHARPQFPYTAGHPGASSRRGPPEPLWGVEHISNSAEILTCSRSSEPTPHPACTQTGQRAWPAVRTVDGLSQPASWRRRHFPDPSVGGG